MEENPELATEGDDEHHEPVGAELMELAEVLKWNKFIEESKNAP